MERKELIFKAVKEYIENGVKYRVAVSAKLADECKNGVCDFSVMADVYEIKGPGRPRFVGCGCCHDEVLKAFPDLKSVVDLHLCNYLGQPTYPVEDGMYLLRESRGKGMEYLRVKSFTDGEKLESAAKSGDKKYFTFLLFHLGIVDAWKAEADAAIQLLQKLTGYTWVNTYEEPRRTLQPLSTAESLEIAAKLSAGYYHPAAIEARIMEEEAAKVDQARANLVRKFDKQVEEINKEREVMLYLFDTFGPRAVENAIYYNKSGKVGLNWRGYGESLTPEETEHVQKTFDFSRFPYVTGIEDRSKK